MFFRVGGIDGRPYRAVLMSLLCPASRFHTSFGNYHDSVTAHRIPPPAPLSHHRQKRIYLVNEECSRSFFLFEWKTGEVEGFGRLLHRPTTTTTTGASQTIIHLTLLLFLTPPSKTAGSKPPWGFRHFPFYLLTIPRNGKKDLHPRNCHADERFPKIIHFNRRNYFCLPPQIKNRAHGRNASGR